VIPEAEVPLSREAEDRQQRPAWVGDVEQLRRLSLKLEDLGKEPLRRELEENVNPPSEPEKWREYMEDVFSVTMVLEEHDFKATYTGPSDEVLSEFDPHSQVDKIMLRLPKSHCETAAGDHGACRRASLDGGS
jgi:hypothetical protein